MSVAGAMRRRVSSGPQDLFAFAPVGLPRRPPAATVERRFGQLPAAPLPPAPGTAGIIAPPDDVGRPPGARRFLSGKRVKVDGALALTETRLSDPAVPMLAPAYDPSQWDVGRQTIRSRGRRVVMARVAGYRPQDQRLAAYPSYGQGIMHGRVLRVVPWRPLDQTVSMMPYAPVRPVGRRQPWPWGSLVPSD